MTEEATDKSSKDTKKRPFFLSVICMAIFVYAIFLALLFLFALIYNTWVTSALNEFFPEKILSSSHVVIISLIGFILNIVSVVGAIFLWKLRRIGFYFYLFSNLIFILLPFFIGYGNLYSAIIFIVILLLILIFYRKFR